MTTLSNLTKTVKRPSKRLGQGHGSGKVKTGGRGQKGQKARGTIPPRLKEGGISFVKRLPLFRGKGKNKRIAHKPLVVNLKQLSNVKKNTVINLEFLVHERLVKKDEADILGVKILGEGQIAVPLIFQIACSGGARKKIEKAGGKVA